MTDFFTLKWGDKYGPEYVNRLYGSLKTHYHLPFTFTCYTDNHQGLREEVLVRDIQDLRPYNTDRVFTYEKIMLMEKHEEGILFDLDVLIHKDITIEAQKKVIGLCGITMIWNYWNDYDTRSLAKYGKGVSCHVNSSFVKWKNADWLVQYTHDNWKKIEFTYRSLDKYLFYQHARNDRLSYWNKSICSNYNREGLELNNKITLFNTSHVSHANLPGREFELYEADKETVKLWKSYEYV